MAKTNTAGADQAPAELTLEQATARIAELEVLVKQIQDDADEKIDDLQIINGALESTLSTLEADAKKSEKTISDLKSELEDAAEVIEELKAQAASAGTGKSKGPIVKVGKSEYLIVGGTVIKQKAYKPEDIAADKQLCEKLIEKGSTLLVKLK